MMTFEQKLIEAAKAARENAYAPYSNFRVGAAVLCADDTIYTGCNVENASFGLTCCAERSAIFKAVSEGKRHFKAVCIVLDSPKPSAPCGACRQVIYEFGADTQVIVANLQLDTVVTEKISALMPRGFGPSNLSIDY